MRKLSPYFTFIVELISRQTNMPFSSSEASTAESLLERRFAPLMKFLQKSAIFS